MAFYVSKSGKYMRHFNQKIGLQAMINLISRAACSSHEHYSVSENSRITLLPCNRPTLFISRRFESIKPDKQLDYLDDRGGSQVLNFPGGIVKFTQELKFLSESTERVPCYRVLDDRGQLLSNDCVQIDKNIAVKMYKDMVMLQTMDSTFYEAQRQGRISFYVTSIGEEAINISSAAALTMDDFVFPQYREAGVLLWRGFTLQDFANQCFGNKFDNGKGRQMPAHYGSKKHNYITVASTVGTQVLHAVGAAYALKMDGKDACTITYFGDGGSSTGDFHAALNFAAVVEAPVIFFCRNNGWAISTPVSDQFRSDGIVVRGQAYGVRSIRVDGNDALAVFNAVHVARKMAINESRPVLIES
ncbi:2-oxoisovalerate dehydrogenase subunit alpha 2, mitochondrial-like isoform X2 [Primulina tabacum]|uniref:2-oxoisovalerate dehydrogenase subunit alpha 2, mitochondrial-like isoform X2 n=1 Tax=Primulina tabacum TaxID=48773 RepID=UPI003F59B755